MRTVEFKFDVNERVITAFGNVGIVDMLAVSESNTISYYVRTATGGQWFKETELMPADINTKQQELDLPAAPVTEVVAEAAAPKKGRGKKGSTATESDNSEL